MVDSLQLVPPEGPEPAPDGPDLDGIEILIEEYIQDTQKASILAWVVIAKEDLHIRALETALALFTKPDCSTLAELNECRPHLTEELLKETMGTIIDIKRDHVSFRKPMVRDYFGTKKPLHDLRLWGAKGLEFSIAAACVTYLSLEDFRDLPLPVKFKGWRSDLSQTDPFLTYASKNWHEHIRSVEDARALEPRLDKIVDPSRNNVYLWTDQSSNGGGLGPRHFFRSRAQIAVEKNIPWLAAHLVESTSTGPEDVFPARDLPKIASQAPVILRYLLNLKPEYYRRTINRKILMEARLYKNELVTLQCLLEGGSNLDLPAAFLRRVASNRDPDELFQFLLSRNEHLLPITSTILHSAASNNLGGRKLLALLLNQYPGTRIDADLVGSAITSGHPDTLRVIFQHDLNAPVTDKTLETVVSQEIEPEMFKLVSGMKADLQITSTVVELAVELNREDTVKWLFDKYEDLQVTEKILKKAAFSHGHDLGLTEYLLARCDSKLITHDVLLTAAGRWNSADKMVALLLKHNDTVPISDEILVASTRGLDGELLDLLLEHRGGQEVPKEVVDCAVREKKIRATWTWRSREQLEEDPSLMCVLQRRVPEDPYLQRVLAETDFTPPPPKNPPPTPKPTDLPNAARESDIALVKLLLEKGIDVNTNHGTPACGCDKTKGHGTALQRAVKQRDEEMTRLLLDHGANPDLQDGPMGNPLQEAAKVGDFQLVKLLVEHEADVNLVLNGLASPLIAAAKSDDAKIVRYLIEHGADINIADEHGWTPYIHAVASESWDAADALREAGSAIPALGELIALVPSKLVKVDNKSSVDFSEDGLTAKIGKSEGVQRSPIMGIMSYSFNTDTIESDPAKRQILFRADHPIVPTLPFYFEITVSHVGGGHG